MRQGSVVGRRRVVVLLLWAVAVALFWLDARLQGRSPVEQLQQWLAYIADSPNGLVVLIGLYLLRPLLLLPMTSLTVFAGFLFGPFPGVLFALAAMLLSASFAYLIARVMGRGVVQPGRGRFWQRFERHSFEAILTSRLMFVPGDIVNYTSGVLRVPYGAFLLATAIGGLPGLMMGVLAGASIEGSFRFTGLAFRPWYLLASLGLLLVSVSVSTWLRRRRPLPLEGFEAALERGADQGAE